MPFSEMRSLLVLVATVAAGIAAASATPATPEGSAFERQVVLERQIIVELNQVRQARGLSMLRVAPGLRSVAAAHSRAMLASGVFGHDSPDGTPFHQRIRRHYSSRGWETWSVGETLLSANGAITADAIVSAWVASRPHRRVIMSPGWKDVGIGVLFASAAPGDFHGLPTTAVTADFGFRVGK